MSDTTFITDSAPQHPLQRNNTVGPKGVFEVRKSENGVYVRVDMPGVNSNDVRVYKGDDSMIHLQGFCNKFFDWLLEGFGPSNRVVDWHLDESARFYYGCIKVICEDFDKVSFVKEAENGSCRLFINGAQDCILGYRTTSVDKKHVKDVPPNSWHLQGGDSIQIQSLTEYKLEKHPLDCHCCEGQNYEATYKIGPPLSEEMGYINPFVFHGVKGVFETKFEPLPDGSGDSSMYFRFDMPDAASPGLEISEEGIAVTGNSGLLNPAHELNEAAERKYFCALRLKCDCCYFDVSENISSCLLDGVFRMIVKVIRKSNVIKEVSSDRANIDIPAELGECSTSTSAAESLSRNSNRRRSGRGGRHGQT